MQARWRYAAVAALVCGTMGSASASPITILPSGTSVAIPPLNTFTSGPITFGPNITWTASSSLAVFGLTTGYWTQGINWDVDPVIGTTNFDISMSFTFATPISAFLSQVTWVLYPGYRPGQHDVSMTAFDASNGVIESMLLSDGMTNLATPATFMGFQENAPIISKIVFSNGAIAIRDISISSGIPEASTWLMTIIGFAGLGFMAGRGRLNVGRARRQLRSSIAC